MLDAGVITGFTAVVDPEALGWTTEAYVELWCASSSTPAKVLAVAARHPQVVSACDDLGRGRRPGPRAGHERPRLRTGAGTDRRRPRRGPDQERHRAQPGVLRT
jgi:hypothetical protein